MQEFDFQENSEWYLVYGKNEGLKTFLAVGHSDYTENWLKKAIANERKSKKKKRQSDNSEPHEIQKIRENAKRLWVEMAQIHSQLGRMKAKERYEAQKKILKLNTQNRSCWTKIDFYEKNGFLPVEAEILSDEPLILYTEIRTRQTRLAPSRIQRKSKVEISKIKDEIKARQAKLKELGFEKYA